MHSRITRRLVLACTLVAALLVVVTGATASPSALHKAPPPSPIKQLVKSLSGLSPQARENRLYDLAKREGGTLEWYTSLSRTISPTVVKLFEEKYSGLKVKLYRASSEDVAARLYQEASADASGADVVETNGTEMSFFQHRKNILIPYRGSPYASGVPKEYRFDAWTAERVEAFVVAWNKNLVKSGEEPKRFTDLAQSKWQGKLSMEPGDIDWFAGMYQYLEKQQLAKLKKAKTKAARKRQIARVRRNLDRTFAAIARNSQITSGHTTQATLLAAGQFGVCVSCHAQSIEQLSDRGAPITFRPFVNPLLIRPQGIGLVYRLKHPATALLFYDWMLRKDGGQKALIDNGAEPARTDMEDPQLRGSKRVPIDLRPIVSTYKRWFDKYEAIIRLGKS